MRMAAIVVTFGVYLNTFILKQQPLDQVKTVELRTQKFLDGSCYH